MGEMAVGKNWHKPFSEYVPQRRHPRDTFDRRTITLSPSVRQDEAEKDLGISSDVGEFVEALKAVATRAKRGGKVVKAKAKKPPAERKAKPHKRGMVITQETIAGSVLGLIRESGVLTTAEIIARSGFKPNSVRTCTSRLYANGYVSFDEGVGWSIKESVNEIHNDKAVPEVPV